MGELEPGLVGETEMIVNEADTAARLGSGLLPVLGTPALVGLMEGAAVRSLSSCLLPGQTSVGGRIDVRHLAPTPVGMYVRARAELTQVEGHRLVFQIEAWDQDEQVGKATHERFIVQEERFLAKAQSKAGAAHA
jgi:predicted thioesterase